MRHASTLEELLDQPGLTDPAPAAYEQCSARAVVTGVPDPLKVSVEGGQLFAPADEPPHEPHLS